MKKRFVLLISSVALCLIASVAADRVVGSLRPRQAPGLIFPTNVSRHFQTPEFSFTVKTNSLGFRDREFTGQRTARIRIMALGDSFTYGWGVEIEQSWPKVLERRLRDAGLDVEVANLGKPAGSPRNYAEIAEKAVPMLKPDFLIVAVLQGDDLAQMDLPPAPDSNRNQNDERDASVKHTRLRAVAKWAYPNLLAMIDARGNADPVLAEQWKKEARIFLTVFTPEENARFERIDATAKQAFLNGELNPALVYLSIHSPEYFSQATELNSPKVASLISKMAEQFLRLKSVARQHGAEVLIVSMPYGAYVSEASAKSRQLIGFKVDPQMLISEAADEATRNASQTAGVKFYERTREFRQASTHRNFFFEWDGHLNVAGHDFFAQALAAPIKEEINARGLR